MSSTKTRLAATATLLTLAALTTAGLSPATATEPPCGAPGNHIDGTPGDDVLVGTKGRDIIRGFGGHDIILGKGGNDSLFGGRGYDVVIGGLGDDCVFGGPGPDYVVGDADSPNPGTGNNQVNGGGGEDEGWYHESPQWNSVERGKYTA